ncbi:MAG: PHP domain-containing protein [Mycoplasmataceae bacterium]|nr:PHP domain-containing protein [Mycoplasmataceae bacterium]
MNNLFFKHNYHTHTIYCHHAKNTVEENIKVAIKFGYKTLGFSEHAPLNVHRNFRLNLNEIDDYINEIKFYKAKYKKNINILIGFEAEYHRSQYQYYKKLRTKVDYMILGNHNIGNPHKSRDLKVIKLLNLDKYGEQLEDACKSGLFSAIAHPDYIYNFYHSWDEDAIRLADLMIDCSLEYDIPLCFNINGLMNKKTKMQYPTDYFWEMVANTKCKVLLEADAHDVWTMSERPVTKALSLIKKWNLQKNLIAKLKFK